MDSTYCSTVAKIQLVSQELKLVLIGSQGAGKNIIGNGILGKKLFTFLTSKSMRRTIYTSKTLTVSGTQINLTRIRGWRGDLSRSEQTKNDIVLCVQSLNKTGPHAVLLALKVNSVLSELTITTLEDLQLWDHTIVVFTHADKLGDETIEDYIIRKQLQHLIEKCGRRYYVFQKNNSNQIKKIKELVFNKISANVKLRKSKDAETEESKNIIQEKEEKQQQQHDMASNELKKIVTENDVRHVSTRSYIQNPLHDLSSNGSDLHDWGVALLEILEELSNDQLKKFTCLMRLQWKTPKSSLEGKDRCDLVELIIEKWGEQESVLKTRDLMKKIPRNDDKMTDRFQPYLEKIGARW